MASKKVSTKVILDGSNFSDWQKTLQLKLMSEDLWTIVSGSRTPVMAIDDRGASVPSDKAFAKESSQAMLMIYESLSSRYKHYVMHLVDPKVAWEKIQSLFNKSTASSKLALANQFQAIDMDSDIDQFFSKLRQCIENHKAAGVLITDETAVAKVVASLRKSGRFESFCGYYDLISDQPGFSMSLDQIEQKVLTLHSSNEESPSLSQPSASLASSSNFKGKPKQGDNKKKPCSFCGKPGHSEPKCFKKHPELAPKSKLGGKKPTALINTALINTAEFSPDESHPWLVDSGASGHQTYQRSILYDVRAPTPSEMHIKGIGTSSSLKVELVGKVKGYAWVGSSKTEITLLDVKYVPGSDFNLFSRGAIPESAGVYTETKGDVTSFFKADGLFMEAVRNETKYLNLYGLHFKPIQQNQVNASLPAPAKVDDLAVQHERFVHISPRQIQQMARDEAVIGLPSKLKGTVNYCEPCCKGKMTDISHLSSQSKNKYISAGEVIHMDICGYARPSYWKNKYFLLIKDEYSSYRKVYFLKSKGDVYSKFLLFQNELKVETGNVVRKVRTDRGSEFTSGRMKQLFENQGIIVEFAATATPQQNGTAERENRTIIEHATSILTASSFNRQFWDEAVNTVVYVLNRTTSGNNKVTPYQRWFGVKPSVQHLHIFGSKGQALLKQSKGKFQSKTKDVFFLGYDMSSDTMFRCYDPQLKTIDIYDAVKFDDVPFGPKPPPSVPDFQPIVAEWNNAASAPSSEFSCSDGEEMAEDISEQAIAPQSEPSKRTRKVYQANPERLASLRSHAKRTTNVETVPQQHCSLVAGDLPLTYNEAVASEESEKWKEAIQSEYDSIMSNSTWDLVDLPAGKKPVGVKWVFKVKQVPSVRYKARLVALGYSQREGVDYFDTYSPVVMLPSIRVLLSIAASMNLEIVQFDVCTAFLNGTIDEEIYLRQPPGYDDGTGRVCKLIKGLYGLKQSPRAWNSKFNQVLVDAGFKRSTLDLCVYSKTNGDTFILLCLYVDDGLIFSRTLAELDEVLTLLKGHFSLTHSDVSTYVGLEITRDREERTITVRQSAYTTQKLEQFNMTNAKTVSTPVDTNTVYQRNTSTEPVDFPYGQLVGSLIWLSSQTRPDLAYPVSLLSRFLSNPSDSHVKAAKRVLRYLSGTKDHGITLGGKLDLAAYCDSDFAGDRDNRKSTSGHVILYGGPISWYSKQQSTVALSTAEAEYISMSECARSLQFFTKLIAELIQAQPNVPVIYCDNQTAIVIAQADAISQRTRHIDVCYHHVRDLIQDGVLKVSWTPTTSQLADALTKAVPRPILDIFNRGLASSPIPE